jgi:hypothetical protein
LSQSPRSRPRRGVDRSKQRIPTRAAIALGVLLIASGGLLVSPLGQAFGVATAPAPTPAQVDPEGFDPAGPTLPTLSSEQKQVALAIARAYPAVRALTSNRSVSALVVPWYTLETRQLLGAGIDLTWNEPVQVSAARWPTLFYDETETVSPPYQATTATVEATGLTGVHLSIDLAKGRVLGMQALPGARVASFRVDPGFRNTLPPQPTTPR